MTVPFALPWLPASAFEPRAIRRIYGRAIEAWSRQWFTGAEAVISAAWLRQFVPPPLDGRRGSAPVELAPEGGRLLFEAAMAIDLSGMMLNDTDRQTIDACTRAAIDDLITALAASGDERVDEDSAWCDISISLKGERLLSVFLPRARVVAHLKASLPAPPRRRPPLTKRREAVGSTPVEVEGVLGHASLPLRDLRAVAPGDVIILDERLDAGVALSLSATRRALLRGVLERDGRKLRIHL